MSFTPIDGEYIFYEKRYAELGSRFGLPEGQGGLTDNEKTEYNEIFERMIAHHDQKNAELDDEIESAMKIADQEWEKTQRINKEMRNTIKKHQETFLDKCMSLVKRIYELVKRIINNIKIMIVYKKSVSGQTEMREFFFRLEKSYDYFYEKITHLRSYIYKW